VNESRGDLIPVFVKKKLPADSEAPASIVGNEAGRADGGGRRNFVLGAERKDIADDRHESRTDRGTGNGKRGDDKCASRRLLSFLIFFIRLRLVVLFVGLRRGLRWRGGLRGARLRCGRGWGLRRVICGLGRRRRFLSATRQRDADAGRTEKQNAESAVKQRLVPAAKFEVRRIAAFHFQRPSL